MHPNTTLYTVPEAELFTQLDSASNGLSAEKAAKVLDDAGPNTVAVGRRQSALLDLLDRCRNPLVVQLLIIAMVSYLMGDLRSMSVVGGMVFLSVFLSYFQETRSSRAVEKLQKLVKTTVTVLRDAKEVEVLLEEIVPGDVVILAAGSLIPADLRIITAKDFFVTQSALTGESMPVEKNAEPEQPAGRGAFDFTNACFMGSNVLSGSARGVVLATGAGTYFGSLAQKLGSKREATSFDKGVRGFTWLMIRFMVVMVSITFLIVGLTKHNWAEALLFALSVAVGLTPEMLPMIMTVCLSKGALMMARKKVIVKHLHAIQNFGAMDVLCTDKTGTLTQDHVVLERYVDVANRPSEDVLRYAYMNSFYQTGLRNLLDRAILAHSELDVERNCRKVDEIPFDFKRRRMSVVIDYEDRHVLVCKGAVEEVAAACDNYQVDDDINPLIRLIRDDLMDEYRNLSAQGYRVLAIAYREFDRSKQTFSVADESELILLGYIAFFDPAKDTAAKAIGALARSGVAVKILTGDNELVTRKVCGDVAMPITKMLTGPQLATLDEAAFARAVDEANVLARLTPDQKEKVIKTLRAQGHVVGFMGDGINDVLAMKAADVGHLRRHRGRRCQGVGGHHPARKEPPRFGGRHHRRPEGLRQYHQVHQNGRQLELRKHVQRGGRRLFPAVSADGANSGAGEQPPLRFFAGGHSARQRGPGVPGQAAALEHQEHPELHGFYRAHQLDLRLCHVFSDALFLRLHQARPRRAGGARPFLHSSGGSRRHLRRGTFSHRLVRRIDSHANAHRAHHPHPPHSLHPKPRQQDDEFHHRPHHGGRRLAALFPVARYLGFVPLPPVFFIWLAVFLGAYSILTHSVKMWFARRFGTD